MNFAQSFNHKLQSIFPVTFLVYFKVNSVNSVIISSDIMNKSVEVQVTALKRYVKCEISSINNKTESLFEHLYKMSNTENRALDILQESIFFFYRKN